MTKLTTLFHWKKPFNGAEGGVTIVNTKIKADELIARADIAIKKLVDQRGEFTTDAASRLAKMLREEGLYILASAIMELAEQRDSLRQRLIEAEARNIPQVVAAAPERTAELLLNERMAALSDPCRLIDAAHACISADKPLCHLCESPCCESVAVDHANANESDNESIIGAEKK